LGFRIDTDIAYAEYSGIPGRPSDHVLVIRGFRQLLGSFENLKSLLHPGLRLQPESDE
jgi:hypothetical protein